MLVVIGTLRCDPSLHDQFVAASAELSSKTRAEPGCLAYWFAEDVEVPTTFRFVACWESEETLEAHRHVEHLADYRRFSSAHQAELQVLENVKYDVSSFGAL